MHSKNMHSKNLAGPSLTKSINLFVTWLGMVFKLENCYGAQPASATADVVAGSSWSGQGLPNRRKSKQGRALTTGRVRQSGRQASNPQPQQYFFTRPLSFFRSRGGALAIACVCAQPLSCQHAQPELQADGEPSSSASDPPRLPRLTTRRQTVFQGQTLGPGGLTAKGC